MSDSATPDHNAAETPGIYQPPTASVDEVGSNARFYSTGPFKFTLLYLATLGLYGIYWSYKNWRFIRDRDNSDVIPLLRAFFYPLTFYWFLKSLAPSIESRWLSSTLVQVALSVIMLAFSMTSALPEPYVFISLLGFVVFLPVVIAMVAQAREKPVSAVRVPAFHWSNAFAYLVGIPFLLLITASVTGVIPSSMVVSGDKLRDSDIAYLREAGILGEEEQILHFYSTAMFSIADDGQFYSTEYVTSYYTDPDTDELVLFYAAYEDIQDIDVIWSQSFMEDTIATVTSDDGSQFEVWLSAEQDGDRQFVDGMTAIWRDKRPADP